MSYHVFGRLYRFHCFSWPLVEVVDIPNRLGNVFFSDKSEFDHIHITLFSGKDFLTTNSWWKNTNKKPFFGRNMERERTIFGETFIELFELMQFTALYSICAIMARIHFKWLYVFVYTFNWDKIQDFEETPTIMPSTTNGWPPSPINGPWSLAFNVQILSSDSSFSKSALFSPIAS